MVNVIDYANECENDNHDPGCSCGAPHFLEALARAKDASKPDPYRPGKPNLLYFKEVVPSTHMDHLTHYWVLTDHKGVRIAEAAGFFRYKQEAMFNCLLIFAKEIWEGHHTVTDVEDWNLLMEVGAELESKAISA